jgi:hypothetical protein
MTTDGRLPPVFPVVAYDGDPGWIMPLSLDPLIGLPPESPIWQWQPQVRYHIIDEGAFSETDLASRDTLAALLFRLENCREADQVIALVDAVIDWFRRHDGFDALRPMFAALAGRVVAMTDGAAPSVQVSENLLEVRTMLATRAAEWKQQWRQEGQQEGKAEMLLRLLEHRFGPVPDEAQGRIAAADLPTWRNGSCASWMPSASTTLCHRGSVAAPGFSRSPTGAAQPRRADLTRHSRVPPNPRSLKRLNAPSRRAR